MLNNKINKLFDIIAQALEGSTRPGGDAARDLAALADLVRAAPLAEVTPLPQDAGQRLPVCRYWGDAIELARAGAASAIAAALEPIAAALEWIQNPNYTVAALGRRFVDNYGYADILGPRGLVPNDRLAVGVLLLAPHTTYPSHAHPALEVYCVLGGAAEWQRGEGSWVVRPPGSLIHHPPGLPHATRTAAEPLLTLYLWHGHLDTPAALTGKSNTGPSKQDRFKVDQ